MCLYICRHARVCVRVFVRLRIHLKACAYVCMCVHACMFVRMYVCVCARLRMYTSACVYGCVCVRLRMCTAECIRLHVCTAACVYVYMCVRLHVCMSTCVCVRLRVCVCINVCKNDSLRESRGIRGRTKSRIKQQRDRKHDPRLFGGDAMTVAAVTTALTVVLGQRASRRDRITPP